MKGGFKIDLPEDFKAEEVIEILSGQIEGAINVSPETRSPMRALDYNRSAIFSSKFSLVNYRSTETCYDKWNSKLSPYHVSSFSLLL